MIELYLSAKTYAVGIISLIKTIKRLRHSVRLGYLVIPLILYATTASAQNSSDDFVTTWRTPVDNSLIAIPTAGEGYDYVVDWGDGTTNHVDPSIYGGRSWHTYAKAGDYQVRISGNFPRIYFNNTDNFDKSQIRSVDNWGTGQWTSMEGAFYGANNLVIKATDTPDLSGVTSMKEMFRRGFLERSKLKDIGGSMGNWNTANVTNMVHAFSGTGSFNQDISSWNTSKVTDMGDMFQYSVFNRDIGSWDTSKVENMGSMFSRNIVFNQDISSWNTEKVTNMSSMFFKNIVFNQDIGRWNTEEVTNMNFMFYEATAFNQDISGWNIPKGIDMSSMFSGTTAFSQNLGSWYITPDTLALDYFVILNSEVARFTSQNQFLKNQTHTYSLVGNSDVFALTSDGVLTLKQRPTLPEYQITVESQGGFGTDNILVVTLMLQQRQMILLPLGELLQTMKLLLSQQLVVVIIILWTGEMVIRIATNLATLHTAMLQLEIIKCVSAVISQEFTLTTSMVITKQKYVLSTTGELRNGFRWKELFMVLII